MSSPKKSAAAKLSSTELESMRVILLDRRRAATATQASQLNELSDPSSRSHLADLEEMSDSAEIDSFCEIIDLQGSTVTQIDAALEKIAQGTYGLCEDCDAAIPRARLEALPFANLCVECQRQRELNPASSDATGTMGEFEFE